MNESYQYDNLLSDLKYLRKGEGLTPVTTRNASTLLTLLGDAAMPFKSFRQQFINAIREIWVADQRDCLMAAYGLAPGYREIALLKSRRDRYGSEIGLRREAVADRENNAIHELAAILFLKRFSYLPKKHRQSARKGKLLHEHVALEVGINNRFWSHTTESYRVIPLVSDIGYIEVTSETPTTITPITECIASTETAYNGMSHKLHFANALVTGKQASFGFRLKPNTDLYEASHMGQHTRAIKVPTLNCDYCVSFTGERPQRICGYKHLSNNDSTIYSKDNSVLDLNEDGVARHSFSEMHDGHSCGISWDWD